MTAITIRTLTETAEFQRLGEIWNSLLERCEDRNPFLTWEWHYGWWTHLGRGRGLNLLLFERRGDLVGVAPLVRTRRRYGFVEIETLDSIGYGSADYGGFVLAEYPSECVQAFLEYVRHEAGRGAVCRLGQLPEHSRCLREIRRFAPDHARDLTTEYTPGQPCPYVSIQGTWDDYFSRLSRKHREDLRRKMRKVAADHRARISTFDDEACATRTSRALTTLYRQKWGARTAAEEAFFSALLDGWTERGWGRYSSITLDGEIASAVFSIAFGGKLYYYRPAVHPGYSKYSLGHLHLMELIRRAHADGVREYDLLRGDQDYKFAWATGTRGTCGVTFHGRAFWSTVKWRASRQAERFWRILRRGLSSNVELWRKRRKGRSGPGAEARERWQRLGNGEPREDLRR